MVGLIFKVHPHQLLRAADDAQLDDGPQRRIALQQADHTLLCQQPLKAMRRLIVTDDSEQRDLGAQRLDIQCHIGSAAQPVFLALHMDDGHRCLGRDAVHIAKPVAVQHRVADHQHTASSHTGSF